MNRYRISIEECDLLLLLFKQHCRRNRNVYTHMHTGSSSAAGYGMSLDDWLDWMCPSTATLGSKRSVVCMKYIAKPLAEALFVSKLNGNKTEWRFFDFAEFAISFGTGYCYSYPYTHVHILIHIYIRTHVHTCAHMLHMLIHT